MNFLYHTEIHISLTTINVVKNGKNVANNYTNEI